MRCGKSPGFLSPLFPRQLDAEAAVAAAAALAVAAAAPAAEANLIINVLRSLRHAHACYLLRREKERN